MMWWEGGGQGVSDIFFKIYMPRFKGIKISTELFLASTHYK